MSDSGSGSKDSVTEVAEESFVRERPPDIERGTVLAGRYQIEDVIGRGGSGIVLRVFDRAAQNVVALKVLKAELARDTKWEKRFSRELRLGRPIQHPNVCRIFDIGEADGHRFLTMEIARGGSLRDELKLGDALERPLEAKMADARAVIAGLAALHAAGVVHRDFKPDNLLRMEDGRLVLSDFGLATDAATAPGATVLIGTPHYMAPEVLAGEPATSRSDVWALGVVLHEIFFGRRPERRSVSFDGAGKGPIRPSSSAERSMLALCERCLADAPLDRPADAGEVATMFAASRLSRPDRGGPEKTGKVVGYALVFLALVVGGGVVARHRRSAPASAVRGAGGTIALRAATHPPADWTKTARVITEIPGRVHCFSVIDERTAQIIWGTPRRAEDVDVSTGRRRPSPLVPEAYAAGCPELSPSGSALLFTALTSAGAKEIRWSQARDGGAATTMTSGSEPMWLGGNDEFLFTVDPSHAAVFSLPTMTFTLLPDPKVEGHRLITNKAVGKDGRALALLLYGDDATFVLDVYSGRAFETQKVFSTPRVQRVQFGEDDDEIVVPFGSSGPNTTLAAIDWQRETISELGRYAGFDLLAKKEIGGMETLLGRQISGDAWLVEGTRRTRLTSDGRITSAARSLSGDLLLGKREGGRSVIWWQGSDGTSRKLTNGEEDVTPDFSPDGRWWAYADYTRKSIILCSVSGGTCRVLRNDELLPSWPKFSPDGKSLAYATQVGSTQVTVISAEDGHYLVSWDAFPLCPPVWSSWATVWSLEIFAGRYVWFERDLTGKKTGKRYETQREDAPTDEFHCWPKAPSPDSPPPQQIRVERAETSRLLALPRSD